MKATMSPTDQLSLAILYPGHHLAACSLSVGAHLPLLRVSRRSCHSSVTPLMRRLSRMLRSPFLALEPVDLSTSWGVPVS